VAVLVVDAEKTGNCDHLKKIHASECIAKESKDCSTIRTLMHSMCPIDHKCFHAASKLAEANAHCKFLGEGNDGDDDPAPTPDDTDAAIQAMEDSVHVGDDIVAQAQAVAAETNCANTKTGLDTGASARCINTECNVQKGKLACNSPNGQGGQAWSPSKDCPDGGILATGVYVDFFNEVWAKANQTNTIQGMCVPWISGDAASHLMYCANHEGFKTCTKVGVYHVHGMSKKAGVFAWKRIYCKTDSDGNIAYCSTYKAGRCIDVGEDVWASTDENSVAHPNGIALRQQFATLAVQKLQEGGTAGACGNAVGALGWSDKDLGGDFVFGY
jgi:hypothetical protein